MYGALNYNGKIVLTFSAYTENPENTNLLNPEKNEIGKTLKSLSMPFIFKEFTTNEITLWEIREKLADSLKAQYIKECNEYLYYDKKNEAKDLLGVLKKGLGRRYIYTIEKKGL